MADPSGKTGNGIEGARGLLGASLVEVRDVAKIYLANSQHVHAIDNVEFSIRPSEFVSVLGPSGCGKSTLLMMVAGLTPISRGEVLIGGRAVHGPHTDLGIVFQQDVLLDWRTVLDNILLQAQIRGLAVRDYRERALNLLELVGLADFAGRYPYELSGGMRQRVAICRALVHDPPLLLMDEPFGALDALTRDQLNLDLQRICGQERKTVLFVTHSISEAVFLSDRIIVMTPRPGQVQQIVDVSLPRPRHFSARETSDFSSYTQKIRRLFEASGVLRDAS